LVVERTTAVLPARSHTATFLNAAREVGLKVIRANSGQTEGASETMVTQSNGSRFSAADAYLKPARKRANLVVRTGAHTTRVLFAGTRAKEWRTSRAGSSGR
jgi:choline dehydrogenase